MKTVYLVKKAISMYSYLIWTPINKISFFLNGVRFGKNLKCRGNEIVIGNNVGISNAAFSCYERIEIEENAFIGAGCKFYDNDFHPIEYQKRVFTNEKPKSAPIMIREGAFVGGYIRIEGRYHWKAQCSWSRFCGNKEYSR